MNVYHYTTWTAFSEAYRSGALRCGPGRSSVLFFSPDEFWAPTGFSGLASGQPLQWQEMVHMGLFRFGAPASNLMPVGQLQRTRGIDLHEVQRQLRVLAQTGTDLTGWRALFLSRSIADFISDRFAHGAWQRIERQDERGGEPG